VELLAAKYVYRGRFRAAPPFPHAERHALTTGWRWGLPMMNRQTMIALSVAIVLGLIAVFLANSWFTNTRQKQLAGGTTKVAVAAVPMAFGVEVTPDKVRFVEYPNASIPPGSFTNAAQLMPGGKKRVALLPMAVNEPILASKISAIGQGASISALLPDGMRAATVRVNAVSGVAGFIQPNDSVDVLITRSNPNGDGQVTDVLLQNIRVIAIDQKSKNTTGAPDVASTATLEVNPIDAQKLALGEAAGSLSLVLRKPGEQNNPVQHVRRRALSGACGCRRISGSAPGRSDVGAARSSAEESYREAVRHQRRDRPWGAGQSVQGGGLWQVKHCGASRCSQRALRRLARPSPRSPRSALPKVFMPASSMCRSIRARSFAPTGRMRKR
jgi:pilus assembly protein CpaB